MEAEGYARPPAVTQEFAPVYLTVVSPLSMTQVWGLAPSHASLRKRCVSAHGIHREEQPTW